MGFNAGKLVEMLELAAERVASYTRHSMIPISKGSRFLLVMALLAGTASLVVASPGDKTVWKSVQFAIVRYNDDAPASWNMYHGEKKGTLLLRLWKRYLLVNVQEQEVFEIDPGKVKIEGDAAEWSPSDIPDEPIETSTWTVRDVGPMRRVKFRFGKDGNFVDIQLPLLRNGTPAY